MPVQVEPAGIVLALATAVAAGFVGCFALMKRMSLAGDVISHITLPGLALAVLYGVQPLVGAAATLLIGTLLIWRLERGSALPTDSAIGVIFIAALAVGALLTPEEELYEALFGGFQNPGTPGFLLGLALVALILWYVWAFRHRLLLALFSPELARTAGLSISRLNLSYLLIFSLTILLALQLLGAILVGALLIVPAAIGRALTDRFSRFLLTSAAASALSVAIGFVLNYLFGLDLGPTIVAVASVLFVLALLAQRLRKAT